MYTDAMVATHVYWMYINIFFLFSADMVSEQTTPKPETTSAARNVAVKDAGILSVDSSKQQTDALDLELAPSNPTEGYIVSSLKRRLLNFVKLYGHAVQRSVGWL